MSELRRLRPTALAALLALAGMSVAGNVSGAAGVVRPPIENRLENGLRVLVFPDLRLPIVQFELLIPAGTATEPEGQSGIANLIAQALRAGSTSRTAAAFAADLARLGGSLTTTAGRDYAQVSGAFLARDLDAGLELVADAVVQPVFPANEVDGIKRQIIGGLLQARGNPVASADERLWSLVFAGHPYGRPILGTAESVPPITVDQLRAFHRDRYRPDRAVLTISGDVTPDRALAAAREWFSSWAGRAATLPAARAPATAAPRILVLDRPGLVRAEIRLGASAVSRDAPDYLALALANHCLGGAPWSRLAHPEGGGHSGNDARSSVTPLRGTGLFTLAASAAPESTGAVVDALRGQLARFLASPPTEQEMARARRYFRNVFPLQLQTLEARASEWLAADFYGLPSDFLTDFDARIEAVTAGAAAAAARHWLDPARLGIVVVGPAARLRETLERFGPVEVIAPPADLAGGPGIEDVQPPSPEQLRRGREVFEQALAAHGGTQRLRSIKDSTIEGSLILFQGTGQMKGEIRQVRKDPYRMLFVTRFENFETRQVLNGRTAWSRAGSDTSDVMDADSVQVLGLRSGYGSDVPHLLLAGIAPGTHQAYLGRDRVEGRDADVVRVEGGGLERRRYSFDVASHQLIAIEEAAPALMGRLARRLYGDYERVQGVLWPKAEDRLVDGSRVMRIAAETVKLDSGVPDALFERPTPSASPRLK